MEQFYLQRNYKKSGVMKMIQITLNGVVVFSGSKLGAGFYLAHNSNPQNYIVNNEQTGREFLRLGGAA